MAKKYIVSISYIKMEFNGMYDAMAFADRAFDALTDEREVEIKIKEVPDETDEDVLIEADKEDNK